MSVIELSRDLFMMIGRLKRARRNGDPHAAGIYAAALKAYVNFRPEHPAVVAVTNRLVAAAT